MIPAAVTDYRELARRRLPRMLFDYIDGGAYAEVTLGRNVGDFQEIALRQRVLRDVSKLQLGTELFGQKLAIPLALGPVGMAGLYHRRGEVQAARAAEAAGVPFCLSTVSICSIEEVRAAIKQPVWLQLYMIKDRGYMRALLERAKAAGSAVLVFTVDLPVPGPRYRDVRSGLTGKLGARARLDRAWQGMSRPGWVRDVYIGGRPHTFGNVAAAMQNARAGKDFGAWISANFDPSVTWNDLDWLREHWSGPIVIKGVLDADDARLAVKAGANGIVVSNHGGRQLDGALSGVRALPAIVDAAGSDLTVLMDGGVRSGLDVLKALALGAKGVLIGRAWAWALGTRGEAGVSHVLEILRRELEAALALTGCTDVRTAGRELLTDPALAASPSPA